MNDEGWDEFCFMGQLGGRWAGVASPMHIGNKDPDLETRKSSRKDGG